MNEQLSMDRLAELRGTTVYDNAGEKIGKVDEIFYDNETNAPEWIGIGTGFFGSKRVLVPVQGASVANDGVTVPYAKDLVKDSPDIDGDEISATTEDDLYRYYSLQGRGSVDTTTHRTDADLSRSEGYVDTGVADRAALDVDRTDVADRGVADVDRTNVADTGEGSLTRSEEELRVGKREVESGRVRLRKWVETEPVSANVDLRTETVHVHREPIDEVVTGGTAQIGEQTIETTLHSEEAVVDKQTVAKERVSLDKDVKVEQQTITDEVRKERVEIEGADETVGHDDTLGHDDTIGRDR